MIQIILLIVGIVYAVRRPKLKASEASQFPDVPADKFEEWKALKLKSIDIFLWATCGLLIISITIGLLAAAVFPGGTMVLQSLFLVPFLPFLVFAEISESKAAKLKKQFGTRKIMKRSSFIKWYWNPLTLSVGLCGYLFFIEIMVKTDVKVQHPVLGTVIMMILFTAALPLVSIIWAWLVALIQAYWGIRCLVKGQGLSGKHNIISAAWVACCYFVLYLLGSKGYLLLGTYGMT